MISSAIIKDIATFDNIGISITGLKPINIIYGANGSGKSTLSKVLANIDSHTDSTVTWKDDSKLEILVYNKDFCEKNFSEQTPGIFTLGEAGVEAVAKIQERRKTLEEIKKQGTGFKNEIEKQSNEKEAELKNFKESAWSDLLKKYESSFPKSAIGAGTKDSFVDKLNAAFKQEHPTELSFEVLKSKAEVLFRSQPVRVESLEFIHPNSLTEIEANKVWTKLIIGKQDVDLAGLISSLGNSDWVSKGLEYIKEDNDVCPFCQQHTISQEFKRKINHFFDETYRRDTDLINTLADTYASICEEMQAQIERCIEIEKAHKKQYLDVKRLQGLLETFKVTYRGNLERMSAKFKEPSRIMNLTDTSHLAKEINVEINKANKAIDAHNQLVDNFAEEKSKLVSEIWKFFASEYETTIAKHQKTITGFAKAIINLNAKWQEKQNEYSNIRAEIIELENTVTSVTPTVHEINRLLKGYGFTNFHIEEIRELPNQYQIIRENGEPAKSTLSEGESTFITFLYFMQLAKGSFKPDGVTSNRVLVVDDPVSSLDSNILYIVSTLLRDVFTQIHDQSGPVKQIILLTHNVFFHKEVAFKDKHCKWRDNVNYWILRKKNNISSIEAYGDESPIKSSYELMWAELKSRTQHSAIVTQNIMRRIIENYFMTLGGMSPDAILEKFNNTEEKIICRALLSWVNDGSHSLPDDLFVETSDEQIDKYMQVFKDIFYRMGQVAHFDMMMQMDDKEDESK